MIRSDRSRGGPSSRRLWFGCGPAVLTARAATDPSRILIRIEAKVPGAPADRPTWGCTIEPSQRILRENDMPTDDQDNTRPCPISLNRICSPIPIPIAPTLQSSRKGVGLKSLTDSQTPPGFRPLASDTSYCEYHFGCARCLLWAIVFEARLVIAVLLCWQLRLLPSWQLRLTPGELPQPLWCFSAF
jgi:hypothetical protein